MFTTGETVFLDFEKCGRTDGRYVQKQLSLPAVTVGRAIGSIIISLFLWADTTTPNNLHGCRYSDDNNLFSMGLSAYYFTYLIK